MADKSEKATFKCEICQTTHGKEDDYRNHLAGNKHKKKLNKHNAEIQNKVKQEECEKKGVFIGNLPYNFDHMDLLSYISSFGKIEKSVLKERFAKILFENEQSAVNFRNTKHNYRNCTLRIGKWIVDVSSLEDEKQDTDKQIHETVAKAIAETCSIDEQVDALLSVVLIPSSQVSYSCRELYNDLRTALQNVYGLEFSMHMFGSVITGLSFGSSDLDVVVDTNFTLQRYMKHDVSQESFHIEKVALTKIANTLWKRFRNVVTIPSAKIPIVKCVHRTTNISCDVSFTNVTGVQNSYLIQCYVQSDPRVKALLVIIKYWAKYFSIKKIFFSNYALVMMGLYYLMQLDSSHLPPVIYLQRSAQRRIDIDGWNCSFDFQYNFKRLDSSLTVLDLLQGFFEFYARFDYGMYVICPLLGKAVPKIYFRNVEQLPRELVLTQLNGEEALERVTSFKIESSVCIQDPFILDRNITGSMRNDFAVRFRKLLMCSQRVLKEECVQSGRTGFLKHLLQKRTEDLLFIPSYWRQPVSNNVEIEINVDCHVPSLESNANITIDEVRNAWYDRVFTVVKNDILEKIFLFEVKDTESSNQTENLDDDISPSKKRKEDTEVGLSSTGNAEIFEKLKTIICKREGPDLCSNRKNITKEITLKENMSFIEMNEAISRQMVKLGGPIETVMFMCSFHLMSQPTHIILEMSNLGCENSFKSWVSYITAHLPVWLVHLMPTCVEGSSGGVCVPSPQEKVCSTPQ